MFHIMLRNLLGMLRMRIIKRVSIPLRLIGIEFSDAILMSIWKN
jgi:hypothetical protein